MTTTEVLPQRTVASSLSWGLRPFSWETLIGCGCQRLDAATVQRVSHVSSQRAAVPEWSHHRREGSPHPRRASDGPSEVRRPAAWEARPNAHGKWTGCDSRLRNGSETSKNKGDGLPSCTPDQWKTSFDEPFVRRSRKFSKFELIGGNVRPEKHGMGRNIPPRSAFRLFSSGFRMRTRDEGIAEGKKQKLGVGRRSIGCDIGDDINSGMCRAECAMYTVHTTTGLCPTNTILALTPASPPHIVTYTSYKYTSA